MPDPQAPQNPELVQAVEEEGLRYISDAAEGITRKKNGEGSLYLSQTGRKIEEKATIDRINSLRIPPAWANVWICPSPNGYLQAVGFDEKGRKQYIYHPEWVKVTQENKFSKMVMFGELLPVIRRKISRDMEDDSLSREKILATVVWLLSHTLIRVGNEEYAKENNSFGLTTLRNRHVKIKGKTVNFEFRGKSGVEHTVAVTNPKIAKILKECVELPGYEIFQYIDDEKEKHGIDSQAVNEYLKSISGEDISAKDFRTWGGTVLSAGTLYELGAYDSETEFKRNIQTTVKKVCTHLRNTAAVCKSYYIHPIVIESYKEKHLNPHFEIFRKSENKPTGLSMDEYATMTLLEKYS
jgi:DNA topoisomerase-1